MSLSGSASWLQAFYQTVGVVAIGQQQPEKPVALSSPETRRFAEAEARVDSHELLAVHVAWHAYADRQFHTRAHTRLAESEATSGSSRSG